MIKQAKNNLQRPTALMIISPTYAVTLKRKGFTYQDNKKTRAATLFLERTRSPCNPSNKKPFCNAMNVNTEAANWGLWSWSWVFVFAWQSLTLGWIFWVIHSWNDWQLTWVFSTCDSSSSLQKAELPSPLRSTLMPFLFGTVLTLTVPWAGIPSWMLLGARGCCWGPRHYALRWGWWVAPGSTRAAGNGSQVRRNTLSEYLRRERQRGKGP